MANLTDYINPISRRLAGALLLLGLAGAAQAAPEAPPRSAKANPAQDLYLLTPAPTLGGALGLFRTITSDLGPKNTFRVGLHLQGFHQDDFLVAGSNGIKGDSNTRLAGDLTIDYTPWRYFQVYLSLLGSSNQNSRPEVAPARLDPQLIVRLGGLATGIKGQVAIAPWLDLGLHLGVRLFSGISTVGFKGSATSFAPDLLASFDLRHAALTRRVPLRFHVNLGYLIDNSGALLPKHQCEGSTGNDPCIRSRVVESFAYGVGSDRFRLAGAVDAPLTLLRGKLGLEPFFEYHAEIAVGGGDQTVLTALRGSPGISNARLKGNSLQYVTLGLRVRPVGGLVVGAGLDVGLSSPGFQYGPPLPAWNVILGVSYAYDPRTRPTKVITRIVRAPPIRVVEGQLVGTVRDARTGLPIANAVIRYVAQPLSPQLTGPDGHFTSYRLPAGPVALEVAQEGYQTARLGAVIPPSGEAPLEVLLTPRPPPDGVLRVRVSDEAGAPIANPTVHLTNVASGAVVAAETEGGSSFLATLPPGAYLAEVSAEGYLSRIERVTIAAGQAQALDLSLQKKPPRPHVSLGASEIKIHGTIHFGPNDATLRPDSEQLLNEVVDLLLHHPEIKKVRVEGHTDNRGNAARNLALSKARAAAVVAYLERQGISADRLESEGYGATQPLVPNITPAQRAKNRRVAFKILEMAQ